MPELLQGFLARAVSPLHKSSGTIPSNISDWYSFDVTADRSAHGADSAYGTAPTMGLFSPLGSKSPATRPDNEQFHSFTSGHWLWDEAKQLEKHWIDFDVEALQKKAIALASAKRCTDITKLSETGDARIFRLTLDKGTIIAKLPYKTTCSLSVLSQAATMDFAVQIGLPVPAMLAYSNSDEVRAPYILMEDCGAPLEDVTEDIISKLAACVNVLASYKFNQIGSIYFAVDNVPGATPAIVNGPLSSKIAQRYAIGPTVDEMWWKDGRYPHGPWQTAKQYWQAIGSREQLYLMNAPERVQKPLQPRPQGTKTEHLGLLTKFTAASAVLEGLPLEPILWPALRRENVFVRKGKVMLTGWEWVKPMALAYVKPNMMLLPSTLAPEIVAMRWQKLRQAWIQALSPEMSKVESIRSQCVVQPLQVGDTWVDGAASLREGLVTLWEMWLQISDKPVPYAMTDEDIARQEEEARLVDVFAGVRQRLKVDAEGFVQTGGPETSPYMVTQICQEALASAKSGDREELAGGLAWCAGIA